ncbi:hypothetical protein L596_013798 [Steinernema carpocapsae]|uniref:Uncharacterized protein n=1 Tax=Steinernema carpocapsae TaxID=34508 RepID=A0A4U5P243_STECR|nr:hypothetical protein L596_013798 [Steinernema carpocapsae]
MNRVSEKTTKETPDGIKKSQQKEAEEEKTTKEKPSKSSRTHQPFSSKWCPQDDTFRRLCVSIFRFKHAYFACVLICIVPRSFKTTSIWIPNRAKS